MMKIPICKRMQPHTARRVIINVMCNNGLMNGFGGDTSQSFRDQQIGGFDELTPEERGQWLAANTFNLTKYCRVPTWLQARAMQD